jgi:hypothetical protein
MSQSLSPFPTFAHALRLLLRYWGVLLLFPVVVVGFFYLLFVLAASVGFLVSGFLIALLGTSYAILASYFLAREAAVAHARGFDALARRLAEITIFVILSALLFAVLLPTIEEMAGALLLVGVVLSPLLQLVVAYLQIRLLVLPTVIAVEDRSIIGSIGRAWSLTGSNHWGTVIIAIVMTVFFGILVTALSVLLAAAFAGGEGEGGAWGALAGFLLGFFLGCALYIPFAIAVQAAVYLRLAAAESPPAAPIDGLRSVWQTRS